MPQRQPCSRGERRPVHVEAPAHAQLRGTAAAPSKLAARTPSPARSRRSSSRARRYPAGGASPSQAACECRRCAGWASVSAKRSQRNRKRSRKPRGSSTSSSTTSSQSCPAAGCAASSPLRFSNLPRVAGRRGVQLARRGASARSSARIALASCAALRPRDAEHEHAPQRRLVARGARRARSSRPLSSSPAVASSSRARRRSASSAPTVPLAPGEEVVGVPARRRARRVRAAGARSRRASASAWRSRPGAVRDHRQPGGAAAPQHVTEAAGERAQLGAGRGRDPAAGVEAPRAAPAREGGAAERAQPRVGAGAPVLDRRRRRRRAPRGALPARSRRVPATPARRRRRRASRRTGRHARAPRGGSPCSSPRRSGSRSRSPRSSVVIGGSSRPQLRGAGPSRRATIRPAKTSLLGVLGGRPQQRGEPARRARGRRRRGTRRARRRSRATPRLRAALRPRGGALGHVARAVALGERARGARSPGPSSTTSTSAPCSAACGGERGERRPRGSRGGRASGSRSRPAAPWLARESRFDAGDGPLPAQPLPHDRWRGAGRRGPAARWSASASASAPSCSTRDSAAHRRGPRGGAGCCAAGSTRARSPRAVRRAGRERRARPQPAARVRLARARGRARGGRARRAAPPPVPPRLRGRRVLHRRRGVHALPRPQHAARGSCATAAASRAEALVYGAALALWQRPHGALADAIVVPSRFARERLARARRAAARARVDVLRAAARGARPAAAGPAVRRAAAMRWSSRASRPRRALTSRSSACRIAGVPLRIAGDGPERARLRAPRGRAPTCASSARSSAARAGRAARRRRDRARPLALGRDLRDRRRRGDGRRAAGRGEPRRARCPSCSSAERARRSGRCRPRSAAAIGRLAGDRRRGSGGRARACAALCSPETVATGCRAIYDGVPLQAPAGVSAAAPPIPRKLGACPAPQRALITGINGQDGSFLAELLLDQGYEVTGWSRAARDGPLGPASTCASGSTLRGGDLLDRASLRAAIERAAAARDLPPRRALLRARLLGRTRRETLIAIAGSCAALLAGGARRSTRRPASSSPPRGRSSATRRRARRTSARRAARRTPTRSRSSPRTSSSGRCATTTACTRARGSSTTTSPSAAPSTSSRGGSAAPRRRSRSASRAR